MKKSFFNSLSIKRQYVFVFSLAFILTLLIYGVFIIIDKGAFFFYGDYTVQQIPFYMEANRAIKAGEFLWDFNTDLGINFLGSYTFYLLGSPFFWISMIFPFKAMAYVLPYLMCLKIACAALFSFIFIKRYVKNNEYAFIGGMIYAFSSFTIYNIFFNHFAESIAFFPLLMIGIDVLIEDNKKGVLLFAVALNAIVNFYFFIAQCIFLFIYFMVRLLSNSFKNITIKKYLLLIFEGVLGIGIAAVFLLVSYLAVVQIPRSSYRLSGWNYLFYNEIQNYANILISFFLPPELPAFPNFYSKIGAKWSSIAAFLPLFSFAGVLAYLQRKRKDWLSYLIIILIFMAFVPALNASFQLFSESFYTRWFFMLILFMSLATAIALETLSDNALIRGIKYTAIITLIISVPVGLIKDTAKKNELFPKNLLVKYFDRYLVYIIIAITCLLIYYILIKRIGRNNRDFFGASIVSLSLIILLIGNYFIASGRLYKNEPSDANTFIEQNINGREKLTLPDIDNVRSDVLNGMDNQTLYWQVPGLQAFHSIVPGSITDFYMSLGVQRDVGSRPEKSHLWLRSLLSVKYLFDSKNSENIYMDGFSKIGTMNNFTVWQNENYIPFGFAYNKFATEKYFKDTTAEEREKLLLKAIVLNDEQIEKYGKNLQSLSSDFVSYISNDEAKLCAKERANMAISSFQKQKNGFSATINLESDNLVCFTFPFEKGFSATVNGKPVAIEKVNVGLMAVYCEKGFNEIRFTYLTPGLKTGLIISGTFIVISLFYIFSAIFFERRKRPSCRLGR